MIQKSSFNFFKILTDKEAIKKIESSDGWIYTLDLKAAHMQLLSTKIIVLPEPEQSFRRPWVEFESLQQYEFIFSIIHLTYCLTCSF